MDKTGLIWKFPVNRELTRAEQNAHLRVDEVCVKPASLRTTIRMNSTYLEVCDKFYFWKGEITAAGLFSTIGCFCFLWMPINEMFVYSTLPEDEKGESLFFIIAILAMFIPCLLIVWFTWLSKELFRYSHYPIRFNRKNRKVYFFRLDGTVMCEDWEKLYFTLGAGEEHKDEKEVHCHRLATDGKTVLETYALPVPSVVHKPRSQWEFVRRYMEEGPEKVLPLIDHVLDVHIGKGRREGFVHGFEMICFDVGKYVAIPLLPLTLFYAIGRWIAMRVAKYPEWPAEVEAECAVEPDDPYLVDADHLPKGVKP